MSNLKSIVEEAYKAINKFTKVDCFEIAKQIQSKHASFSGSLFDLHLSEKARKSITLYLEGEFYGALFYAWQVLFDYVSSLKMTEDDDIATMNEITGDIRGILEEYKVAKQEFKEDFLEEIQKSKLFNDGDFADSPAPVELILKTKESFKDKNIFLKMYSLAENNDIDLRGKQIIYKDTILASTNYNDLIVKKYSDDITIGIGLCIEEIIDFSYFVFNIQYKNSQWIMTDKIEFDNPEQAQKLRNPGRKAQDRERSIELPYSLIDNVIEMREKNDTITKKSGTELYTFPLADINKYCKLSIYLNVKNALEKIIRKDGKFEVMRPALEYANEVGDKVKSDFIDINTKKFEALYNELFPTSTELAVIPKTLALRYANETSNALVSKKEFEKHVAFLVAKEEATKAEDQFYKFTEEEENERVFSWGAIVPEAHKNAIAEKMKENLDRLYKYIFSGETVRIFDIDQPRVSGDLVHYNDPEKRRPLLWRNYATEFVTNTGDSGFVRSYYIKGKDGRCKYCGKSKLTNAEQYVHLNFRRYTHMMGIFGLTRDELPGAFRHYLSCWHIPYVGNTALSNVNPKWAIVGRDDASLAYPNGFMFSVGICKKCKNKLLKQYKIADETVIVISSKENKIVECIDVEQFKEKYYKIYEEEELARDAKLWATGSATAFPSF